MDKDISGCKNTIEMISAGVYFPDGSSHIQEVAVLKEHMLDLKINGKSYRKIVCIDEYLEELAIGRLYTDKLISGMRDIADIRLSDDGSIMEVTLKNTSSHQDKDVYEDSCGGIRTRGDVSGTRAKTDAGLPDSGLIFRLANRFADDTKLHKMTGAAHSCMLASMDEILFSCEDIGRHNAVDKAIGFGFKSGADLSRCIIYTSGRVPVDMVLKVINAGIPVLISKAVPTDKSVALAKEHGLRLICRCRPDGYTVIN